MPIDENNVRNLIIATLAKHLSGGCCDQVCAAWQELYNLRNFATSAYDPVETAIAEHYLFARCKVCSAEYSVAQMKAMVQIYAEAKRKGLGELLKSNSGIPTTRPTDEAITWGLLGATEGETDRVRCYPTKVPPRATVPKFFKKKIGY